jgi:hypothetical protein
MDAGVPTEVLEASVANMIKARPVPEDSLDISEKKRAAEEEAPVEVAAKRSRRSVKFSDEVVEDSPPEPAPKKKAPRGRRMARTLGVRDDGDDDAEAAAPPAPRLPSRTGTRSQLTKYDVRHLARCHGELIPPSRLPPTDNDDDVSNLVEARLIPSLMSLKSVAGAVEAPETLDSFKGLKSSLINRAIVSNVFEFAKGVGKVTSAMLGSFLATFRDDTDPLMDGPALGDDE